MDPFEIPNHHKSAKDYSLDDFIVIGAQCFICNQQVCTDEVYFVVFFETLL